MEFERFAGGLSMSRRMRGNVGGGSLRGCADVSDARNGGLQGCCRPLFSLLRSLRGKGIPPGPGTVAKDRISGQERTFPGRAVKGQEVVDTAQLRFAAERAEAVIDPLALQKGIRIRDVGLIGIFQSEQGTAERELVLAFAVGEEAIVAHAAKLRRRDMREEAADEFIGRQAHPLLDRLFFLGLGLPRIVGNDAHRRTTGRRRRGPQSSG